MVSHEQLNFFHGLYGVPPLPPSLRPKPSACTLIYVSHKKGFSYGKSSLRFESIWNYEYGDIHGLSMPIINKYPERKTDKNYSIIGDIKPLVPSRPVPSCPVQKQQTTAKT